MTGKTIFWITDVLTMILGVLVIMNNKNGAAGIVLGVFTIVAAAVVGVAYKILCDQ